MKTALTIAGSDSCGGAGIQADIKTMTVNGVYAMSAVTALTAQNTTGVKDIMEVSSSFLKEQLECIFTDIYPDSVKIGMIASKELIKTVKDALIKYKAKNIVLDPVMVATSGAKLISDDAIDTLKKELLPISGDMKDKIDPYLQPLYDSLEDMIPAVKLQDMMEKHIIQIAPLAFMRGRTLSDAIVILDEAQNTTSQQIRMFLTRMGTNTKMIITGDMTQIDLPRDQRSGLKEALKILEGVEGIGVVNLGQKDIVRHKLVTRIVNAYDKYDKERAEAREARLAEKENTK